VAPTALDRQKLAAARLWAANRYPYLAAALFAAPVVAEEGSGTASADAGWRVHVDPATLASWSVEELGSVFVHLSGHLLRSHAERAQEAGVDDDTADHWTDSADAEINDDLANELVFPARPVLPADLGLPEGRLAEEYFRSGHRREDPCWTCGSSAHGQGGDGDAEGRDGGAGDTGSDQPAGLSDESKRLLRRQVANDVLAHQRQAGNVPAGIARWAAETVAGRVDWRKALAAELRRGLTQVAGRVDYTYQRPSRRSSASADVVLPALRRPVPDVAVVCDTSASMNDHQLATVLAEIDGLLRSVGLGAHMVRVLSCDTAASAAQRITSSRQVELWGGGGTDMGAGIRAATELRPRPAVVVVLTDGETPWPVEAPKGVQVVVGLIGERPPAPPRWARAVRIDEESPVAPSPARGRSGR